MNCPAFRNLTRTKSSDDWIHFCSDNIFLRWRNASSSKNPPPEPILKILCLTHHDLDAPAYGAALRAGNLFRLLTRHGDVRVVRAGSHKFWDDQPQKTFGGFELLRSVPFLPTPKLFIAEKLRHEFDPRFLNTNGFQASAADRV